MEHSNFYIQALIIIAISTLIFSIVSYFEGKGKIRNAVQDNSKILLSLIILIVISACFVYFAKTMRELENDVTYLWGIGIALKVLSAAIVVDFAKKQNRNTTLWWVLGLLEYHSALIVLAFSGSLLRLKNSTNENLKNIEDDYNSKIIKLNDLFKSRIINEEELQIKCAELESDFQKESLKIISIANNMQFEKEQEDLISKLENAYKDGILSEEEYKEKINKVKTDAENIGKDGENIEKEKFQKLYEKKVITYDEMITKFKQIENYYREKNS